MVNRMFLAVLLTLSLFMATFAVHAGAQDVAKAGDAKTKYDTLLESLIQRVKSKDPSWGDKEASRTFKELRFAYTETPQRAEKWLSPTESTNRPGG